MTTYRRSILWLAGLVLSTPTFDTMRICAADPPAAPAAPAVSLHFAPASDGSFTFNTGVLRGRLRPGGKSLGLAEVVHVPTGKPLSRSNGLFSHYRVFTRGQRYGGGAWDWPSTARLREDGAVEVTFPPASDRPFAMSAVYRWIALDTLDLETTLEAKADLVGFESFLASYFETAFTNSLVLAHPEADRAKAARFLPAPREAGDWQMFPRDDAATALIQDGRWKLEPNPVNWTLRGRLATPLAVRRAPASGLAAVMLAPAADCFAIATPYDGEGHFSTYLSLFGRDFKSGDKARASTRLIINTGLTDLEILRRQQAFLKAIKPAP